MIFEDEHLLVVNKPAGWNTHAPSLHAGEGIYDWLRNREPRWARLSILHRLDKETSGVLVFGKDRMANRSLADQFARRRIQKHYLFLTDRAAPSESWTARNRIVRRGPRYTAVSGGQAGEPAETRFRIVSRRPDRLLVEAEPVTGRTHQIRVHAEAGGVPILGDRLYGGSPFHRVCVLAARLTLDDPVTGEARCFEAPADFDADTGRALRAAVVAHEETNAFRLVHGAADGWPGWTVDTLGEYLLSQSDADPTPGQENELRRWAALMGARAVYHRRLARRMQKALPDGGCPQLMLGVPAPDRFVVRENGLCFELSFREGYSVGLFLDQRDNRRRLLTGHVGAGFPAPASGPGGTRAEVLNLFAYTCAFSVCAARNRARVTSVDLSRKSLEWGRRNFELNRLDPGGHAFLHGDAFDWMHRLHKKARRFGVVIVDPPTFSQSRQSGVFRAEQDYGRLARMAVRLLEPDGVLLVSTNAAQWVPSAFIETVRGAIRSEQRTVLAEQYVPQPPDHPIQPRHPGHLKTAWFSVR